ncbi:MAG: 3-phosphoshikimate 1-carboxyvinyltransferase [Crocinitomix sp.]|nr:3-phosphoshikimate 1-carboxyvinyltransferase [Crocinitomix sp.]
MEVFIDANQIITEVNIPPSKSYAQRAILAAALSYNTSLLQNVGSSADVLAMIEVAKKLGAKVEIQDPNISITGSINPIERNLNVGESGLGMRLVTAIAAVLDGDFVLAGEGSLMDRPMDEFARILPQLGVAYEQVKDAGHFQIFGNAHPSKIEMDGALSSQYLSGLLMALPLLEGDSHIFVHKLKSKPYINITLDVMEAFSVHVEHKQFSHFSISGNQNYQLEQTFKIEGDYSGASIWMVHGALNNGILIKGLNPQSVQGDKQMLQALTVADVNYNWTNDGLKIIKSTINPFHFDATECPDLFPSLVVLAAAANGISKVTGTHRLIHKESNRALVLQKEFRELGLDIELKADSMIIHGTGTLKDGNIHSNNDHRIAMAGAIAACLTKNGITVVNSESVAKSYPEFWQNFEL